MPPIVHELPTISRRSNTTSDNLINNKKDTLVDTNKKSGVTITVSGVSYAISDEWCKSHPGGRVIYEFDNKDATDVFAAFHSTRAFAMLPNFRKVPLTISESISAETRDFREMREKMEKEGWLKASPVYYAYKTIFNLCMFSVVAALCVNFPGQIWAIVLAALVLGSAMSQCGWLAHDYLHHQVFANRHYNNLLGHFVGGVLQGYCPTWWKHKHNTHHAVCNVHGADPDINTVPIVAWSDMDIPAVNLQSPLWKFHLKHQVIMFPLVLCFAQFSWRLQSFLTAFGKESREPIHERVSLTLHYMMMAWMAWTISTTWAQFALFIVLEEVFGSYGKAVPFVLNHGGCPVVPDNHDLSFLRLQVITSRDVQPGLFMDWFMGGLNYQIEHHLFPTMPRHNLPKVKPLVIALCKKHNIPYTSSSFFEGFQQMFAALAKISSAV